MTKPTSCGNNKTKIYKAVNQPLANLFSLPVKWITERPWKKNKPINTTEISPRALNSRGPKNSNVFNNRQNASNMAKNFGHLNDKNSCEKPPGLYSFDWYQRDIRREVIKKNWRSNIDHICTWLLTILSSASERFNSLTGRLLRKVDTLSIQKISTL